MRPVVCLAALCLGCSRPAETRRFEHPDVKLSDGEFDRKYFPDSVRERESYDKKRREYERKAQESFDRWVKEKDLRPVGDLSLYREYQSLMEEADKWRLQAAAVAEEMDKMRRFKKEDLGAR